MTGPGEVWIGTSGYVYRHWRKGVFYPVGVPAREELGYYAGRFRTVELNNPFYRLPTAEMFQRWREPEGGFTDAELASWAAQIHALRSSRKEVYVYFNNDWAGYAIRDAMKLRELLGVPR